MDLPKPVMPPAAELCPGIALQLDEAAPTRTPSFLNWAVEEIERLRTRITSDSTREERFEIQYRIATLAGTAHAYGQWLASRDD